MRLGIAISRRAIRAVAVRGDRVTWAAVRELHSLDDLTGALSELAAARPSGARLAHVALEGDLCQLKRLALPPTLSRQKLARAVALQSGRWFLKNGHPLVTAAIPDGLGQGALAAAVEEHVLGYVVDGLMAAGLELGQVTPALMAVAAALPDGDHTRDSDGVRETFAVRSGRLTAVVRREPWNGVASGNRPAVPGLSAEQVDCFAAWAASAGVAALTIDVPRIEVSRARRSRNVVRATLIVGVALWLTAGVTFWMRTARETAKSVAELQTLRPRLDQAVTLQRDIAAADQLLGVVAGARAARSSDLALLQTLTATLPDSTHLVSLRIDASGHAVASVLAPSATRVLALLQRASGIDSAAFDGPVGRDQKNGGTRDRFGVRFIWRGVPLK